MDEREGAEGGVRKGYAIGVISLLFFLPLNRRRYG